MSAVINALQENGNRRHSTSSSFDDNHATPNLCQSLTPVKDTISYIWTEYHDPIKQILTVTIYYIVGCIYYGNVEGWNILDCCYFITVSVTTVGYGDGKLKEKHRYGAI